MYTVFATNHLNTVEFTENYLSYEYAEQVFYTATTCVDCKGACLTDATTGEVLIDFNGVTKELQFY